MGRHTSLTLEQMAAGGGGAAVCWQGARCVARGRQEAGGPCGPSRWAAAAPRGPPSPPPFAASSHAAPPAARAVLVFALSGFFAVLAPAVRERQKLRQRLLPTQSLAPLPSSHPLFAQHSSAVEGRGARLAPRVRGPHHSLARASRLPERNRRSAHARARACARAQQRSAQQRSAQQRTPRTKAGRAAQPVNPH